MSSPLSMQSDERLIYTLFFSRFTVPVLWDKKFNTIVNNENSEIIRILNTAFNEFLQGGARLLPRKIALPNRRVERNPDGSIPT